MMNIRLIWKDSQLEDKKTGMVYGEQTPKNLPFVRDASLIAWMNDCVFNQKQYRSALAQAIVANKEVPYGIEFSSDQLAKKVAESAINFDKVALDAQAAIEAGEFHIMQGVGCLTVERIAFLSGVTLQGHVNGKKEQDLGYEVSFKDPT